MSTREMIDALLDSVPEYKMGYVLAYLQGLTADEEADNAYCEQLYQDYLNDPDPDKHQTISWRSFASGRTWSCEVHHPDRAPR